ncbi:MAG: hypothetical protein GWP10_21795, partial [Nitrospiraceae bacterium]|nr:hypothetical protein [Nitrospiraceae bacterium]
MKIREEEIRVGLLPLDEETGTITEYFPDIEVIDLEHLRKRMYDVVWVHAGKKVGKDTQHRIAEALKAHLEGNGGLLLSLCAAPIINALGYEAAPFNVDTRNWHKKEDFGWEWDFLAKKGFQAFLGHPIFAGLGSSVMTWASAPGKSYCRAGLKGRPHNGKIVAKRKKFIFIEEETDEILEYRSKTGRILVISSLFFFEDRENPYISHLMRFAENVLLYLAGRLDGNARYWPKKFIPGFREEDQPLSAVGPRAIAARIDGDATHLRLTTAIQGEWFDLAGRRVFAVGKRGEGIKEVWAHPIRLLQDASFTFSIEGKRLKDVKQSYAITPAGMEISYRHELSTAKQVMFCALDEPGFITGVELDAAQPLQLDIRFTTDFRLMWPYPKGILGELVYFWDEEGKAFAVRTEDGEFSAMIGCSAASRGSVDRGKGEFSIETPLPIGRSHVLFVAAGGAIPLPEARSVYDKLMRAAEGEYQIVVEHHRKLEEEYFSVKSPDPEFDLAYSWAKVGLDKMYARVPGVGAGFFSGYGPSRPTEFSDGRPGYAWYFGRDSEWMSFAALGCGDFESVRDNLATLIRHQDITGKIFHELTTSGVAHFDAADSTPLMIVVLEEYVKRSGDLDFLASVWPNVKKAMNFLYTTDRDGDGFIENSGVGHGWVEGGELSPFHLSFYLASVWVKTLASAARLAREMGETPLAAKYSSDHAQLKHRLNTDFWNQDNDFFYFARRKDGSYMAEKTVTPAVAMDFNLIDADKATKVLRTLAGYEFSTDWGVRFIGRSSPKFRANGYHQGSVWPLFTGWVARAEYNYHRPVQGFSHLLANLLGYKGWNEGYIEEALSGEFYRPNGVCSHQGWSESMTIYPLIDGMFGLSPDVPHRTLRLSPHLPSHWNRVSVRGIHFGEERIQLEITSSPGKLEYRFAREGTDPISVELSPGITTLNEVKRVSVNGRSAPYKVSSTLGDDHIMVPFALRDSMRVTIDYDFDLAVVPPRVELVPRARSQGIRVVDIR